MTIHIDKTVVQKGIAGFGNRFQVLGFCIDIAVQNRAKLRVDWRDSSWNDDFSNYFDSFNEKLLNNFYPSNAEIFYPNIRPDWWSDKINAQCAKKLAGEDFARITPEILASDWNTLVVCQYKADYSDRIFKYIDFKSRIKSKFLEFKGWIKTPWDCWHIRATDKSNGKTETTLKTIIASKSPNQKVLITDNSNVQEEAVKNGILCPSIIPKIPGKGGIHHSTDEYLYKSGLTRQELNDSTLVDLLIGINAENFHSTCENSSYSQLIERWRKFNEQS